MTLLLLLACNKDDAVPADSDGLIGDSGAPTETDSDAPDECLTVPEEILPADGKSNVYYRDPLAVTFTGPAPDATFSLTTTDDGEAHEPTLIPQWNASDEHADLLVQGYLQASRDYALTITVCDASYTSTFSTGVYGDDLTVDKDEIEGRTYLVRLDEVTFTEPAGFGAFLSVYLDIPILIGVEEITPDGTKMELLGDQGRLKSDGTYTQKHNETRDDGIQYYVATWPFPDVDFNGDPYFSGQADKIELRYSGAKITVHDFQLTGTFAPDGSSFGGGTLAGLGDTAEMAPLFGEADDPYYVCELLEGAGTECEVCPDTEQKTCLYLVGEGITAPELDYIDLIEYDGSPTGQ